MKRCPRCNTVKPDSDFCTLRNHYGKTYLQSWCKACKAALMRESRARHSRPGRVRYWYQPHGERSHLAKLENADIPLIRGLLNDGLSCAEVGRKFEVSRQTISAIKSGRTWTHV